jgi:hypothetical protein
MSNYTGINKLANVFQNKISTAAQTGVVLDFGEIQADGSLKTNQFDVAIPANDYLVCRGAAHTETTLTLTKSGQGQHPHGPSGEHSQYQGSGSHSHPSSEGAHNHDVLRPDSMRAVKPGDRVLVAWVGSDAVVIDIIVQANEVM